MPPIKWNQVPEFYHKYLRQVSAEDIATAFQLHQNTLLPFLAGVPDEQWDFRYAEGKWTIKEVAQHLIDAERIFGYRALTIARGDTVALPGFDENAYTPASRAGRRSKADLLAELEVVQKSSALLFASFDADMLAATGIANGNPVYVEGIGFIIVGHALHHLHILKDRYLSKSAVAG